MGWALSARADQGQRCRCRLVGGRTKKQGNSCGSSWWPCDQCISAWGGVDDTRGLREGNVLNAHTFMGVWGFSRLSVQLLISAQVMISGFMGSSPGSSSVLTARTLLGIFSLPLSLPLPCLLSQNKQINLKKRREEGQRKGTGRVGPSNWRLQDPPHWGPVPP